MQTQTSGYTAIIDINRHDPYLGVIHADGCRNIDYDRTHASYVVTGIRYLRTAVDTVVDAEDRELGYDDSHAVVNPCATIRDREQHGHLVIALLATA